MLRVLCLGVCAALLCACGGDDAPPPPRGAGIAGGRARPEVGNPMLPKNGNRVPITAAPENANRVLPSTVTEKPTTQKSEGPPKRDLEKELQAAYGNPAACLRDETKLEGRLRVSVSVTVTVAGIVTRSSASAPGLSSASLACLQAKASKVRLRSPVPGTPRSVSTNIILNISQKVSTKTEETQQETGFALQEGQQAVQGQKGIEVDAVKGQTIYGPSGTKAIAPSGTAIRGPSGKQIGN